MAEKEENDYKIFEEYVTVKEHIVEKDDNKIVVINI